ncbi:MAG: hypothetical protein ACPG4Z_04130, partial [Chitinophagales bacterium]
EEYPLNPILEKNTDFLPEISIIQSNCWRGYKGTWAIMDDSLFLINLTPPHLQEEIVENPFDIEILFEDYTSLKGVFAYWSTCTLNTKYMISPNDGIYNHFVIKNGILVNQYEKVSNDLNESNESFIQYLPYDKSECEEDENYTTYLIFGGMALIFLVVCKLINNYKK